MDVVATIEVEIGQGVETAPEDPHTPPVAETDEQFAVRLGRPVPVPRPVRPFTRQAGLGELRATRTGRLLYAVLWRMGRLNETGADETTMKMYQRSFDEMPLRGAAIYSGGRLRWSTVDALIDILNGRPHRILRRLRPKR